MDWKYILSLSADALTDEEKDDLYNPVVWFDCDNDILDVEKSVALLRISQEIMKYRSEQVETLLAELDEIAARQGEEEVKTVRSDRSELKTKRSQDSEDYEQLQHKYKELKSKYKQQMKANEKQKKELDKLNEKIAGLEHERQHLRSELQSIHNDDQSQSDVSETFREQYKEIVDSVNQKNKQITQLLNDIEGIESENLVLREKLSTVRDELSEATKQISLMTDEIAGFNIKLDEQSETLMILEQEKIGLRNEIKELVDDKQSREQEIEEFTKAVDARVTKWKEILQKKDCEINALRTQLIVSSPKSSSSELLVDNNSAQLSALNKILAEREEQIAIFQKQLKKATIDTKENTQIIQKLTEERTENNKKVTELLLSNDDLKKQLKLVHNRCHELQENVTYAENLAHCKSKDLRELLNDLKTDGNIELAEVLKQNQDFKSQIRVTERQSADLVKINNKLQLSNHTLQEENYQFREKLGISEEEPVSFVGVSYNQRQQRKELQKVQSQIKDLEAQKLESKFDFQKLNRTIGILSDQIINLGGKPNLNGAVVKNKITKEATEKHKILVEENEALRIGLHEILKSIETKKANSIKEIKSETLEKLLRALDVKHVAGWYHPAMRLQAEVHSIEGANSELREQLRLTRLELNAYKNKRETPENQNAVNNTERKNLVLEVPKDIPSSAEIICNLNNHLLNVLRNYQTEEDINAKLEQYKTDFRHTQQEMDKIYLRYKNEKELWISDKEKLDQEKKESEDKIAVLEARLKEYNDFEEGNTNNVKKFADMAGNLVILNRKCVYLQFEESKYLNEIKKLKQEVVNINSNYSQKMKTLTNNNKEYLIKINMLEIIQQNITDTNNQCELDNLTIKYRELLQNFHNIGDEYSQELMILHKRVELFQKEKLELCNKLNETLGKLYVIETVVSNNDIEQLSNKLAQAEINEISERQRANHTNNLYELVKEQLQNSEERLKEFEKYNKDIMHKNLVLQENLKELGDKSINSVDSNTIADITKKCTSAMEELQRINSENSKLQEKLNEKQENIKITSEAEYEFEILSLKHQILDLQSGTDDKSVIARLSSDVVLARLSETECRKKVDNLMHDLEECQDELTSCKIMLEQEKIKSEECIAPLKSKIGVLEDIIRQHRRQYLGCIPLTCEEKFIENLKQVFFDKLSLFTSLQNAQKYENDFNVAKEQLNEQLTLIKEERATLKNNLDIDKKIIDWYQEKNAIHLQDLKYKRQSEFLEAQLQQTLDRLKKQDSHLSKLEEELLKCYQKMLNPQKETVNSMTMSISKEAKRIPVATDKKVKLTTSQETQTVIQISENGNEQVTEQNELFNNLQAELLATCDLLSVKENVIHQLKLKITEMEMNISLFRQQIGDKQSQILFYEKYIVELQSKKEASQVDVGDISVNQSASEEVLTLKVTISDLQETLNEKENSIIKYQTLLKQDRDKHSLAAVRMQDEVKKLQFTLNAQKAAYESLKDTPPKFENHPGRAAIEQYVLQVHALEKHTADLHTSVSSLNSQLQASREESVRWRSLANERLNSMEQLRKELDEQHDYEIRSYKSESEKWREEVLNLKQVINKHKNENDEATPEYNKKLKEKDDRIHELTITLRQMRGELKRNAEKYEGVNLAKMSELVGSKEQLLKELETLKKRFEQLLNKEKNAREEIRVLRAQLIKRPQSSVRSEKSDISHKEQMQKKVAVLEREVDELRERLEKEMAVNEMHKQRATENFDKWSKQKYWQQTSEKLKSQLKEGNDQYEKLQQTCAGYRILIERLEREKHNLEGRIKMLKSSNGINRFEMIEVENSKLLSEIEVLSSKLQMQQHHSGALGATMLQEKLEAQERKIAILEVSTKGSGEIRAELERQQATIGNLQKSNLRLEAENLELRLDLEKLGNDGPHLREQIQYLENYIEVLKSENQENHTVSEGGDHIRNPETKKASELERTVFVLKRVVEKLQVENKRLLNGGRACTSTDRSGLGDKLRRDFQRLKEQFGESVQTVARLEENLKSANNTIKLLENRSAPDGIIALSDELNKVKAELTQKTLLLDKVKVLLQRAAAKEKALLGEVAALKLLTPSVPRSESA